MALNTTIGSTKAKSFITVSESTSILTAAPIDTTEWNALSTTAKEQRLIYAAGSMAYLPWRGYRVYERQALCFPRSIQVDFSVIPDEIKEAQALIAWLVIHPALAATPSSKGESEPRINSMSLGGAISVSFSGEESGSALNKMTKSPDFMVYFRLGEYLTRFRGRGSGDRPDLLAAID